MKPWVVGAISFVVGAVGASGAWTAFPPKAPPPPPRPEPSAEATDDGLAKANANLTASLHECDRRLAELGERPVGVPVASASAPAAEGSGRRRRGEARAMTKDDWEKMAENGVVPVRIPCIRDKPWTVTDRAADRLGLAPVDRETINAAYAASNKRMIDQIRPLCAQALGSPDAADKVGASQCIDVINSTATKSNADGTKAALSRVAEVQAGKREPPPISSPRGRGAPDGSVDAVEQLGLILTNEQKAFENDLAQKVGPEEAKRLAADPALCSERKMLRAGEVDPSMFGGGRQRGR